MPAPTAPGIELTVFKGSKEGKIFRTTTTKDNLRRDEVLVRITHSGVCGTDQHYRQAGCVLGHEGAGLVAEVGPDVKVLQPYDPPLHARETTRVTHDMGSELTSVAFQGRSGWLGISAELLFPLQAVLHWPTDLLRQPGSLRL